MQTPHISTKAAVFALLTVACSDGPTAAPAPTPQVVAQFAAAQSLKSTETIPFSVPIFMPCLNEEVVWSGTVHYDDHWLIKPDGTVHLNGQASLFPGSTLVGQSGTWSAPKVVSNYTNWFPSDEGKIVERIVWTNLATQQTMIVSVHRQFVVSGNGVVRRDLPYVHTCELK